MGGCNCQPRQRNRNETLPSLLGDREGRARPGDRNTCVNKCDSKEIDSNRTTYSSCGVREEHGLTNTVSETIKNNLKTAREYFYEIELKHTFQEYLNLSTS